VKDGGKRQFSMAEMLATGMDATERALASVNLTGTLSHKTVPFEACS
jgi:hypothetical protein